MNTSKLSCLIFVLLFLAFETANAQTTMVEATITDANFTCPGEISVTYSLTSATAVDVTLFYSPDKCNWMEAIAVTGDITGITTGSGYEILWDNMADRVAFGKFYFKVEFPQTLSSCELLDGIQIGSYCWARSNVNTFGNFAINPYDFGMFYQWNRSAAWDPVTPPTGAVTGWPVINTDQQNASTWAAILDPCPAGWRVPTQAELTNLVSYAVNVNPLATMNGVAGRFFVDGSNTLFLPAVGSRITTNGTLSNQGTFGYYWSREESTANTNYAWCLSFGSTTTNVGSNSKALGFSVRCVAE